MRRANYWLAAIAIGVGMGTTHLLDASPHDMTLEQATADTVADRAAELKQLRADARFAEVSHAAR